MKITCRIMVLGRSCKIKAGVLVLISFKICLFFKKCWHLCALFYVTLFFRMSRIPKIDISGYNYSLPEDRIARYPVEKRHHSKLLVWNKGTIHDDRFFNLTDFLSDDSLLIFNNTKVIRARLFFRKESGALIEIFVLDPDEPSDYVLNFQQTAQCSWKCLVGNLKKWKGGTLSMQVEAEGHQIKLTAENTGAFDNGRIIRFSWDNAAFNFATLLEHAGKMPIPPYLNRESEELDLESYQTVYSKIKGSVAAPTAGLHFTETVFSKLRDKGIGMAELTLHVGAGTFKPVQSQMVDDHQMHNELVVIDKELIETLIGHEGPLIAVGTTSVRSLETLYWLGLRLSLNPEMQPAVHQIEQWEPYHNESCLDKKQALEAVLQHLNKHGLRQIQVSTRIFIVPGYVFRMIDGMLTNFHQPQSTLLLLVSAFIGSDWEKVYRHALENAYRFLSYGDSNLYLRTP